MKGEIIQLMHEFHTNEKLSRGINSSFIVLIPKKDNPIGLGDYRPISLVSSVYKVLAKVLSRRLKRVLPSVISEVQSAFVMEALNLLLRRATEKGLFQGAIVGSQELSVSHLQFADNTIIFCERDLEEVKNLKGVLRCFEVMSGLKINYHKSVVCGVGFQKEQTKKFAQTLNCLTKRMPFNFLGLPLGANPRRKNIWVPVVEKVKKKLSSWKRKLLSFTDRLSLVKSILSNLPIDFLSLFRMPKGVVRSIVKLQSSFLWGGSENKKKVHLVQWREVTKSKWQRGLGVRDVGEVNDGLLLKWWWRYGKEDKALWKSVLCSRYSRIGGGWMPPVSHTGGMSNIWQDIVKLPAVNQHLGDFYEDHFKVFVGNGKRILFWSNDWCLEEQCRGVTATVQKKAVCLGRRGAVEVIKPVGFIPCNQI
ncbi:uncharacterized protein LOC114256899 [Camellia sinensis]|uniref:uncharacterized protein LOC114256899 n=1 Tax=Camellia sinensis TaxID=4442 RepID=UPI00103563D2|nr:uncharacterized protein LOC114256899 [Camellia sinensis]